MESKCGRTHASEQDAEVIDALHAALNETSARSEAYQNVAELLQARLTEEEAVETVLPTVLHLLNKADRESKKRLLSAIAFELFEALAPSIGRSSASAQLLNDICAASHAREVLLMAGEALAMPSRLQDGAEARLLVIVGDSLLRITPSRRQPFLPQAFRLLLASAVRVWNAESDRAEAEEQGAAEAMDEDNACGERKEELGGPRASGEAELEPLDAVLQQVGLLLEDTSRLALSVDDQDRTLAVRQLGNIVGLLLNLCGPDNSKIRPQVLMLLRQSVTGPLARVVSFVYLVDYHRRRRHRRRSVKAKLPRQTEPDSPDATVDGTPVEWQPLLVGLVCHHLLMPPPTLEAASTDRLRAPTDLLPSPLAPLYVARILADNAAALLQKPDKAPLGLTLVEELLRRLPSISMSGEGPLWSRGPREAGTDAESEGREVEDGANAEGEGDHEDTWERIVKGLTACMVYVGDDDVRQRAYRALQSSVAVLDHASRFWLLKASIAEANSQGVRAVLMGLAHKAVAAAWAAPKPTLLASSEVKALYEDVLWRACEKRPDALASWASESEEAQGELDCLMSALNFYRFLLLKDRAKQEPGRTGVWSPTAVFEALPRLKSLQAHAREALKGRGSFHRLGMVDQVLTDHVIPMLEEGHHAVQ